MGNSWKHHSSKENISNFKRAKVVTLRKQFVMAHVKKSAVDVAGTYTSNTISKHIHKSASQGGFGR